MNNKQLFNSESEELSLNKMADDLIKKSSTIATEKSNKFFKNKQINRSKNSN